MLRIFSFLVLIIIALAGYAWYSAQALPNWFDEEVSQEDLAIEALGNKIKQQGISSFLSNKAGQILSGKITFTKLEFNALILENLKLDQDGQKLLAVSDSLKVIINNEQLEFSALINLDKVEKIAPEARKAIEKFDRFFPFLNDSRVSVTLYGSPITRNGNIAIKDDFHIKVGAIPISNSALRQLGANVERANTTDLAIEYLVIREIVLNDGEIELSVSPRP